MDCRNWNKKTPEEQARKTYERAQKLEAEFLEYFTGTLLHRFLANTGLYVEIYFDTSLWICERMFQEVMHHFL